MYNIIVIGGGGHAKVIISILKKIKKFIILGYTDYKDNGEILSIPYLGNDDLIINLNQEYSDLQAVLGIGQVKNSNLRQKILAPFNKLNIQFPPIISPQAIINEGVYIDEGTVVMDAVTINSGTHIGKFSIVNTSSSIDHDCSLGDFVHIAPGSTLCGDIEVGNNVLIGAGSTIIQSRKICDGCIIASGSVVKKDCIKSGLYAGVPLDF